MNYLKPIVITALFAAGTALGAESSMIHVAQAAGSTPMFADLDQDHDGSISQDEAAAFAPLADAFNTVDANQDGKVSAEEYAKAANSGALSNNSDEGDSDTGSDAGSDSD